MGEKVALPSRSSQAGTTEDLEAALMRVTGDESLAQGRRARQPFQVPTQVPTSHGHAMALATSLDVGVQMIAREGEALVRRGGGERFAAVEPCAYFSEDPRVFDGAPSDHDSSASGLEKSSLGIAVAANVSVDHDRNRYDLARLRRPCPVGRAGVPHRRRTTMNREGGNPCVFKATGKVDDGHVRLGSVPDAGLHRDRERHTLNDETRHRDHGRRIAQPACTGPAAGDLGHPTSAIDVDEERGRRLREGCGFGQASRVRAVDLDCGESVVRSESNLPARVAAAAQEPLDVDELGHAESRAVLPAEAAKDGVGDVLHRCKDGRAGREQVAQAVVGRRHGSPRL